MPSGPAGQASFYWKVWSTTLFKCSSYVEDKKVREKKIKKITQNSLLFLFFRDACVVSRAIWKFHPVLTISNFNFFSLSNNSTNQRHLYRTAQPYWAPDKPEHVAEKIDIVTFKTAEISRREKKRNNRGGNIYVPITKLWLFSFFGIVFEFQEIGGSHSYHW